MGEGLFRQHGSQASRFAIFAFLLFVLGSATVLGFAIAERNGLIPKLGESVARLLICTLLLSVLVSSSRGLPRAARIGVLFCAGFLFAELVCEVIEDIDALDNFPLVGHSSRWRHTVEKSLIACWTCSVFFVLYVLMHALEEAQMQLVKQERLSALGQMASGIAHDLNNTLTPVVVLASVLRDEEVSPEHREMLRAIQEGAEHASDVVKQLQHFYKSNHADRRLAPVDLAAVVKDAVKLTHFRLVDEALKQGIWNTVRVESQSDCRVLGDRTELVQVVSNLLINAADAMPNGGCVVVSVQHNQDRVTMQVADDGCGMSVEQSSRCFEPFYTTKMKGSGLGLSVCHGIVTRHGGEIRVASQPSLGTKFTIELPATSQPVLDKSLTSGLAGETHPRVLVIDDDEAVRSSLSALLTSCDVDFDTASTGSEGVQLAREKPYDLVLTDLGMPGMSGVQVVTALRSFCTECRIAVLSGWSKNAVSACFDSQDAKPDFILEKPIVSSRAILECLAQSRRGGR